MTPPPARMQVIRVIGLTYLDVNSEDKVMFLSQRQECLEYIDGQTAIVTACSPRTVFDSGLVFFGLQSGLVILIE